MASVYIGSSGKVFGGGSSIYLSASEREERGVSCKDLSYRVDQHVNKEYMHSFTTVADDWILFVSKDDWRYNQAILIEQHTKNIKSKVYIQNLKAYPEMLDKLIQNTGPDGGPDSSRGGRRISLKQQ